MMHAEKQGRGWGGCLLLQRFKRLLGQAPFALVARVSTPNQGQADETALVIYRKSGSGRRAGPRKLERPILQRGIDGGS